jgi:hypothetical protein
MTRRQPPAIRVLLTKIPVGARRTIMGMTAFCASCAREIIDGPVLRGGWLYCSFSCAREPGAAFTAGREWARAWLGRRAVQGEDAPALPLRLEPAV